MRIQEAQKHLDPAVPDPEHRMEQYYVVPHPVVHIPVTGAHTQF
jgi:hypothetical protein